MYGAHTHTYTTADVYRARDTSDSFYRNSICLKKKNQILWLSFQYQGLFVAVHGELYINKKKIATAAGLSFQMNSLASCKFMTSSGFQGLVYDSGSCL